MNNQSETHDVTDIQSVESRITEIRHDHKDRFVALGELLDNAKDWGKATNVDIFLTKGRITICDNGFGIPSERFPNILKFGNVNSDARTGTIGRFGLGLNKGSIILGEQVSVYTHHIDATTFSKTEADWVDMSTRNRYTPETSEMTELDKELFDSYISGPSGTLVILKELRQSVDETFRNELVMYCRSLFHQMEGLTISIKFEEEEPTIISEWYDPILYDMCSPEHRTHWKINVYEDGQGDYDSVIETSDGLFVVKPTELKHRTKYTKSPTKKTYPEQPYYSFDIFMTRLTDDLLNYEGVQTDKTWEYKKGIYFYRAFRNLNGFVGIKGILPFLQGMNRGMGVRIRVNFTAFEKEFDDYFGVSSLKMIQETSYTNMKPFLQEVIAYACTETHTTYEKYIGDMKTECDKRFIRDLKLITDNTFSVEEITHLEESVKCVFIDKQFKQNDRTFEYKGANTVHKMYKDANSIKPFTDRFRDRIEELEMIKLTTFPVSVIDSDTEYDDSDTEEDTYDIPVTTGPISVQVQEEIQEQFKVQEEVQEPIQEPIQEPVQEPVKEPVKEQVQEPVQEPVKEEVQEQVKEPVQEQVKEPVQEPVQEQEPIDTKIMDIVDKLLQNPEFAKNWSGDKMTLYNAVKGALE